MKVWLNGRRRELKLTAIGRAVSWLLWAAFMAAILVNAAMTGREHLDLWFWICLVAVVLRGAASCRSTVRLLRADRRPRLLTAAVIADKRDERSRR